MITVKNRLKQPLSFNLADGTSKIMLSRATEELTTEQFNSPEIKTAVENKDLIVVKMD